MYNKKKGQASLDFLATYGWAFLIIIVAVAGLAYFDVFSFDKYLPESCSIDQNLMCGNAYKINSTGGVEIQLKNNRQEKITITNFYINEKNLHDGGTDGCTSTPNKDILSRETIDFKEIVSDSSVCGITDNLGNKKTFIIKFDYNVSGTDILGHSSGTLTTEVVA